MARAVDERFTRVVINIVTRADTRAIFAGSIAPRDDATTRRRRSVDAVNNASAISPRYNSL